MKTIFNKTGKSLAIAFGVTLIMVRATCFMSDNVKDMLDNKEKCEKQNDAAACMRLNTRILMKTATQIQVQGAHADKAMSVSYAKQRIQAEAENFTVTGREECAQQNDPQGKSVWLCTLMGNKK